MVIRYRPVYIWYNDTGRGVYGIMIPAGMYMVHLYIETDRGIYGNMIPAGV